MLKGVGRKETKAERIEWMDGVGMGREGNGRRGKKSRHESWAKACIYKSLNLEKIVYLRTQSIYR